MTEETAAVEVLATDLDRELTTTDSLKESQASQYDVVIVLAEQ